VNYLTAGPNGLATSSLESMTLFITAARSDTLITDFTLTPEAGTYFIWANLNFQLVGNGSVVEYLFYKDGSMISASRRTLISQQSNYLMSGDLLTVVTVDGTEAIDVRCFATFSNLLVLGRSMVLLKVAD